MKTICRRHPGAILLARAAAEATILRAVQAGVMGFLSAEGDGAEIIAAIQAVRGGDPYLPPHVAQKFVRGIQQAYREVQRERTPDLNVPGVSGKRDEDCA